MLGIVEDFISTSIFPEPVRPESCSLTSHPRRRFGVLKQVCVDPARRPCFLGHVLSFEEFGKSPHWTQYLSMTWQHLQARRASHPPYFIQLSLDFQSNKTFMVFLHAERDFLIDVLIQKAHLCQQTRLQRSPRWRSIFGW